MRYGLGVSETFGPVTLKQFVDRTQAAADAGFDTAWWAQLSNWDALTAIAVAGPQVPGIRLGTAVVPTYPRHPLMLASQALTVQAAVGNRLRLGIGPSHKIVMDDAHGYSFERPARHIREYLTALIPLLHGESVSYQGETLRAVGEIHVPGAKPPSVLLSALAPAMLKVAGELTDGTITASTGPVTIANHIAPALMKAATAAGRPSPEIVAIVFVSVTNDPAGARQQIAEQFGIAASMPSYRAMLDHEGVSGPADLAVVGDEAVVERELARYADAGVTELLVYPFGSESQQVRTLDLMAALARESARTLIPR